jgi:hypothetical protein
MERHMSGRDDGGRDLGAVALQLAASIVLYLVVDADAATLQAWRMRGWHYTKRAAWWGSARCAAIGLEAERRYDQIKC